MAKTPAPAKPKWYKTIFEAFKFVRENDRLFLPIWIVSMVLVIGGMVTLGILSGTVLVWIYTSLGMLLFGALTTLIVLSTRIDKAAFSRFEGMFGGSLAALQMIRRGWKFEDQPIEIDAKGRAVVFQGVGKGGLVLAAEGGSATHKLMLTARQRVARVVPGVPIHEFYVGTGPGQVPLRKLPRAVKSLKKVLSKRERAAIQARLRALGGGRIPVPKGVDPMKARPDRKALRGR